MEIIDQVEMTTAQQNALLAEQKAHALVGAEYALALQAQAPTAATSEGSSSSAATPTITDAITATIPPLAQELNGNEVFEKKYRWLASKYPSYRPVRRDGSCFYRSALFHVFNVIALEANGCPSRLKKADGSDTCAPLSSAPSVTAANFLKLLDGCKDQLEKYFGSFVEDFIEVTQTTVRAVAALRVQPQPPAGAGAEGKEERAVLAWRRAIGDAVAALLNKEEESAFEYIVCLARYGVSTFLRDNASVFAPFVSHVVDLGDDAVTMQHYCEKEVDTVGSECEETHLMAFCAFFGLSLTIVVMDNNSIGDDGNGNSIIENGANAAMTMRCEEKHFDFSDILSGFCGKSGGAGIFGDSGPNAKASLPLLYRPGHYEVLLPK